MAASTLPKITYSPINRSNRHQLRKILSFPKTLWVATICFKDPFRKRNKLTCAPQKREGPRWTRQTGWDCSQCSDRPGSFPPAFPGLAEGSTPFRRVTKHHPVVVWTCARSELRSWISPWGRHWVNLQVPEKAPFAFFSILTLWVAGLSTERPHPHGCL